MPNLTEHAKTILRAIADDKTLQDLMTDGSYSDRTYPQILITLAEGGGKNIRTAPETRSINGVVFAAPVEDGSGRFSVQQRHRFENMRWPRAEDATLAFNAIIDALEGKTK